MSSYSQRFCGDFKQSVPNVRNFDNTVTTEECYPPRYQMHVGVKEPTRNVVSQNEGFSYNTQHSHSEHGQHYLPPQNNSAGAHSNQFPSSVARYNQPVSHHQDDWRDAHPPSTSEQLSTFQNNQNVANSPRNVEYFQQQINPVTGIGNIQPSAVYNAQGNIQAGVNATSKSQGIESTHQRLSNNIQMETNQNQFNHRSYHQQNEAMHANPVPVRPETYSGQIQNIQQLRDTHQIQQPPNQEQIPQTINNAQRLQLSKQNDGNMSQNLQLQERSQNKLFGYSDNPNPLLHPTANRQYANVNSVQHANPATNIVDARQNISPQTMNSEGQRVYQNTLEQISRLPQQLPEDQYHHTENTQLQGASGTQLLHNPRTQPQQYQQDLQHSNQHLQRPHQFSPDLQNTQYSYRQHAQLNNNMEPVQRQNVPTIHYNQSQIVQQQQNATQNTLRPPIYSQSFVDSREMEPQPTQPQQFIQPPFEHQGTSAINSEPSHQIPPVQQQAYQQQHQTSTFQQLQPHPPSAAYQQNQHQKMYQQQPDRAPTLQQMQPHSPPAVHQQLPQQILPVQEQHTNQSFHAQQQHPNLYTQPHQVDTTFSATPSHVVQNSMLNSEQYSKPAYHMTMPQNYDGNNK